MNREEFLAEVSKCVLSDRNKAYGEPEDNFALIANIARAVFDILLTPAQVGQIQMCVKLARMRTSPEKLDHLIDLAGYAACVAEIQSKKLEQKPPQEQRPLYDPMRLAAELPFAR